MTVAPLTSGISDLVAFAAARQQDVVTLDIRFDGVGDTDDLEVDADADPAYIFICGAIDQRLSMCNSGAEILVSDLRSVPDASLTLQHGQRRLQGRFAIQQVSGPRFGIMSIALRAVSID